MMKIKKYISAAMFIALSTVLTLFVRIPTPVGYIHLGDAVVFVSAMLCGPITSAIVGAFGHSFADVLSGYVIYAAPTFLIKGLMGYFTGKILYNKLAVPRIACAAAVSLVIPAIGYFVTEYFVYGIAIALVSLYSSLIQWAASVAVACALIPVIKKGIKR